MYTILYVSYDLSCTTNLRYKLHCKYYICTTAPEKHNSLSQYAQILPVNVHRTQLPTPSHMRMYRIPQVGYIGRALSLSLFLAPPEC